MALLATVGAAAHSEARRDIAAERKLLAAVLGRAVHDYYSAHPILREEAHSWLFSPEEGSDVFSCHWVCEQLGLQREEFLSRLNARPDINFKQLNLVG